MPECFADITDDIVREHLQPGRTLQDELDVRIWPSIYLDYVLLNLLDTDRYGLLSCVTIAFIIVLYRSIQVQSCKCVYNKLTYLLTYLHTRQTLSNIGVRRNLRAALTLPENFTS